MNERIPHDDELHAYLDGQLEPAHRQWLEAWLAVHPEDARRVQGWRQDAQQLRAAFAGQGGGPLPERLDPAHIRRGLRQRWQARLATAAALLVALGVGGLGGWQMRGDSVARHSLPMQDAVQAYRLFAGADQNVLDLHEGGELRNWLARYLKDATPPPAMDRVGLKTVGARLLATEQGAAALVIYEDGQGRRLTFFIRPPGSHNELLPPGQRTEGDLLTRYWSHGGYNYAVVSRSDDPLAERVGEMVGF
ncbi:anti-sigma factor [Pseudomonas sp. DTU_2021_1001937_2_SI_NGA_ILE_001]|uniref:anti-sigma factor family protein n=1 Tax=Pseudomonas sp. DTU_2021_1001937_2_SI_NGA_ILE_001 TaxID=3077589 RepID=UPI0028FC1CE7|nr:anti-sigma factor [Pseudomonas sp. DTU_2021_1001937_2_SI_NGA_ILE_001]WNW09853.1 anti-sigma factor [Pseudomonas sp. DTU_2021_1001937_2_SI_NGA_ILE_001]